MPKFEIRESAEFSHWLGSLADRRAKAKIHVRIDRMRMGNFGDVAPAGGGVSELRIHYGPGYRIYFVKRGASLVFLLAGGDKSTQARDIDRAKALAGNL